jgi:hypothetical protein
MADARFDFNASHSVKAAHNAAISKEGGGRRTAPARQKGRADAVPTPAEASASWDGWECWYSSFGFSKNAH